jgi:hypothetical protein
MGGLGGSSLVVLGIAGLWLAIAAALLAVAVRRMRDARRLVVSAQSLASLLEVAPARPLLVLPDGSLDIDGRLSRELGFLDLPRSWTDLAGDEVGLLRDHVDMLREAVEGAALSGSTVQLQVKAT